MCSACMAAVIRLALFVRPSIFLQFWSFVSEYLIADDDEHDGLVECRLVYDASLYFIAFCCENCAAEVPVRTRFLENSR